MSNNQQITISDEVKEFLSDLGDDKAAIMQQIKAIKTGQYR